MDDKRVGPVDSVEVRRWNETVRHRDGYPYPDNEVQTHFEGCWRHPRHHNCAVAWAERLAAALGELVELHEMKKQAGVHDEYLRRKPAAWVNARVVLKEF